LIYSADVIILEYSIAHYCTKQAEDNLCYSKRGWGK